MSGNRNKDNNKNTGLLPTRVTRQVAHGYRQFRNKTRKLSNEIPGLQLTSSDYIYTTRNNNNEQHSISNIKDYRDMVSHSHSCVEPDDESVDMMLG